MAHFAECRVDNNEVIRTIVIADADVVANGGNNSSEAETWMANTFPNCPVLTAAFEAASESYPNTYWKQGYKGSGRGLYPNIGQTWDASLEIFKEPKRWSDWVLNETSGLHECPIDYPTSNVQGDSAYSPPDWRVSIGTWICKKADEDKMRRWNTSSKSWNSDEDLIDE